MIKTRQTLFVSLWATIAVCIGAPGFGFAQATITLGDNHESSHVLIAKSQKLEKLSFEQMDHAVLQKLGGKHKSPIFFFDGQSDIHKNGFIGVFNASAISFIDTKMWKKRDTEPEAISTVLKNARPIEAGKIEKQMQDKKKRDWPSKPVRVDDHTIGLLLGNHPSKYIAVLSKQKMYLIEIVAIKSDGSSVQLKLHALK